MKSDYVTRATKFAHVLANLFEGCSDLSDFQSAVLAYNKCHARPLVYAHGVSRFVIVRSDYVIKFNMVPTGPWKDGRAGTNDTELAVYRKAEREGYAHLLAKTTVKNINGWQIAIMPKIDKIDCGSRYWRDYCTCDEEDWLEDNIRDLHEANVGYRNGKVCVIDYAWEW